MDLSVAGVSYCERCFCSRSTSTIAPGQWHCLPSVSHRTTPKKSRNVVALGLFGGNKAESKVICALKYDMGLLIDLKLLFIFLDLYIIVH